MYVGVDSCPAGWIAISGCSAGLAYAVFHSIDELVRAHESAELILLDIPIGLPSAAFPARPCDGLARRFLGRRASSVFSAPCRKAAHSGSIAEARATNLAELGVSLSAQAWGICDKIAEVDAFLQSRHHGSPRVREMHPEICFWSLNGGHPMRHAKKTKAGAAERLMLLDAIDPRAGGLCRQVLAETLRRDVQRDDILDALIGCLTAMGCCTGELSKFIGVPAHDALGLPMEMVFRTL